MDIQEQFLIHFGMHTVEKTADDVLIMRGDGPQPFIEVCKKGVAAVSWGNICC